MEYSMEFHGTLVPPNEISLSSMEFHGTLESPNKNSPSSMGFHGIRRPPFQMTQVFHGNPWNIPWNSMELWYRQMKYNLVPWNSMNIPWNFGAAKWNITKFHGMPWNFKIVIFLNTILPWTCMGYSMEFHGTLQSPNKKITEFQVIPWD